MQKFPLRMKDNDLLVTELYKDPNGDMVTALSVYLTPKTCKKLLYLNITRALIGRPMRFLKVHEIFIIVQVF